MGIVMNHRTYCGVSATLFTVVALAHLTRLINGWSIEIDTLTVPMLASWFGLIGPGVLAVWGFREVRKAD
jgi:hypothetical protein